MWEIHNPVRNLFNIVNICKPFGLLGTSEYDDAVTITVEEVLLENSKVLNGNIINTILLSSLDLLNDYLDVIYADPEVHVAVFI